MSDKLDTCAHPSCDVREDVWLVRRVPKTGKKYTGYCSAKCYNQHLILIRAGAQARVEAFLQKQASK